MAKDLGIPTTDVTSSVLVTQVEKSDVVRVTATGVDAEQSAAIASALATNYVERVRADAAERSKAAIASVDEQLAGLTKQIDALGAQITAIGGQANAAGPLQNQLNSLVSQQVELTSLRDKLLVEQSTLPANTRIVSSAAVSKDPIGIGHITLAIYGAALGFGLGAMVIAIRTAPGRTLEDLESLDQIDGMPVLGLVEAERRWHPSRFIPRRVEARRLRGVRVAGELRALVDKDGPVVMVPVGRSRRLAEVTEELGDLVAERKPATTDSSGQSRALRKDPIFQELAPGLFDVGSVGEFLSSNTVKDLSLVLAVDVVHVSTNDLLDTSATFASLGSEVVGIVGVG